MVHQSGTRTHAADPASRRPRSFASPVYSIFCFCFCFLRARSSIRRKQKARERDPYRPYATNTTPNNAESEPPIVSNRQQTKETEKAINATNERGNNKKRRPPLSCARALNEAPPARQRARERAGVAASGERLRDSRGAPISAAMCFSLSEQEHTQQPHHKPTRANRSAATHSHSRLDAN